MQHKNIIKKMTTIGVLLIANSTVFASGYQSFETNASGLGNAYAGGAAVSSDASSEFDNPASIVRLDHPELDISGVAVMAHGSFLANYATMPIVGGTNQTNPLGTNTLPALHFTSPLTQKLYFGFGVTVPFGYSTNYGYDSYVSNYAQKSEIKAFNLNPSLAYKINEKFSVGLGFDLQYLKATYNRRCMLDASFKNLPLINEAAVNFDGHLLNNAEDWGYGWNAGMLYQFDDATRFGLSYRSGVSHSPSGTARLQGNALVSLLEEPVHVALNWDLNTSINLPDMVLLSGYHDFNQQIAGMATINYTHWSKFDRLAMELTNGMINLGTPTVNENFKDSFRFAIGGNYRFNKQWMWRVGAAYDQSPVNDSNRTIPLPDGNRVWLSTGVQYIFNHYLTADAGYTHIFIANGSVDTIDPLSYRVSGKFSHNYANLLGAQLSLKFN